MVINRNTLGHLDPPDFILVKASEERVGILKCTHKTWQHKFNDMDTISFEIPYLTDNKETPYYDDIDVMKYIEVPTIGRFCIKDIEIVNEGEKTEYKKVDCLDYSCLLGQQYLEDFIINPDDVDGAVGGLDDIYFYLDGDQEHSLLHLILEKFPEWSYGYIPPILRTKKRSFSVTRQDVYSFMTNDVSTAFECIFEFDSISKRILVYEVDSPHWADTNIHVSYNSLLERTEMNYSVDDIKTAIKLRGRDDIDVREINMGKDYIYGFDYYASIDYMSASLLSAYNSWKALFDTPVTLSDYRYKSGIITQANLRGKSYRDAFAFILNRYQEYYTYISEWSSTKLPPGINTRKNPGYGTIVYNGYTYVIEKQTGDPSAIIVDSLPSTGDSTKLYIMNPESSEYPNMYRWKNTWVNVNKWDDCCLAELKTLRSGAERLLSTAQKAGYGNPSGNPTGKTTAEGDNRTAQEKRNEKRYIDTYLPAKCMYEALDAQIAVVEEIIASYKQDQNDIILYDHDVIVEKTSIKNNLTPTQYKELSAFIREDELKSDNYLVTSKMSESERFDQLYGLLHYGESEIARVSVPQIQFSANLVNLFAIPEFDRYSGSFDVGNYVWVTIRDDYSIKAKILEVELDFMDQSVFNVTFGNVIRKAKDIFTDVTDALNTATAAATSVAFNASNWNASAVQTDSIGSALADGLLSQSYYLSNAADNETLINDTGVWITTTVDPEGATEYHGRENTSNYDGIYLGGGRILFTSDGWRTVSMSVGRADVNYPHTDTGNVVWKKESRFGVFADFLIAGYVGGSLIVGGDIYSDGYETNPNDKNSGNYGSHINLKEGTFEFNSPQSNKGKSLPGKKRLRLYTGKKDNKDIDILEVNGVIHASEGNIGSDDNGEGGFIVKHWEMYSGKDSFNATTNGIYLGSNPAIDKLDINGISLGAYNSTTKRNPFSVDMNGKLVSTSGYIGGYSIEDKKLFIGKDSFNALKEGIFLGGDISNDAETRKTQGISIGKYNAETKRNPFSVDMNGYLTSISGYIGGFNITNTYLANGKDSLNTTSNGIYLGINGISLGASTYDSTTQKWTDHKFRVTNEGALWSTSGKIGGWSIGTNTISHKSGSNTITLSAKDNNLSFNDKIVLYGNGSMTAADGLFTINTKGHIHAEAGDIGSWEISKNALYSGKKTSLNDADNESGIFLGPDGITLGKASEKDSMGNWIPKFKVTKAGTLTSSSGSIGGWNISASTLTGGKITLNSDGSMKHNDDVWSISSSGYAKFTNVYISGVHSGSSFGNMGYDGKSYNWGTFGGESYYGCSSSIRPFSGGSTYHIQDIALDYLEVKWLVAGKIKADLLTADNITTGTLDASKVTVKDLSASSITTGTLDASKITVKNLSADSISTGSLSASRISYNGNSVVGQTGYVFTHDPVGSVVVDGVAYEVNIINTRKMNIMGYYGD